MGGGGGGGLVNTIIGAATGGLAGAGIGFGLDQQAKQAKDARDDVQNLVRNQQREATRQRDEAAKRRKTEQARSQAVSKRRAALARQQGSRGAKGGTLLTGAQGVQGQGNSRLGDSGRTLLGS